MSETDLDTQDSASTDRVIDLAERIRSRELESARRPKPEHVAFSLFLLASRLPRVRDHALFYVFIEGAPTMIAVAAFTREHRALFGTDVSIVDLREHFDNPVDVLETARHLRETAGGATILAPALGLGPLLLRNG